MTVHIEKQDAGYLLHSTVRLPRPRDEVFPFFADAHNLDKLTPAKLRFQVLTPGPIEMSEGTLIDYRLKIRGVPVKWRSEITVWEPNHRFVDEQRRGPYRWWRHEHLFECDGDETIAIDNVSYGVIGGALINRFLVAPDLIDIFQFRTEKLLSNFG